MNPDSLRVFLTEAKALAAKSKRRFLQRNLDDLGELGITNTNEAWRQILQLQPRDYFRGPSPDFDRQGTSLWEFKKDVNGIKTYIKLKIDERGCVCISFHKDRPGSGTD